MMIFCNTKLGKIAIPDNRIYNIRLRDSRIEISYNAGEITFLGENGEAVAPKIEGITINFDTPELALENFRDYYEACEKQKGAFYFG